ncbi:MAG: hypothetical protein SGBAC_010048 [Bacillariaceae sp.]
MPRSQHQHQHQHQQQQQQQQQQQRLPTPPELTPTQKLDVKRLWETQTQDVPDVKPTSHAASDSTPTLDHGQSCHMITRLHAFFLEFLEQVCEQNGGVTLSQVSAVDENLALQGSHAAFLKPIPESCLEPFAQLFLVKERIAPNNNNRNNNHTEHDENSMHYANGDDEDYPTTNDRRKMIIRPRGGRRVLVIQYEEFLDELNYYEFRGNASKEFLMANSFGAFLYHFPIQAIPVMNVSLALAVASLWRAKTSPNVISSSKMARLERFLDTCQLTVRLIHVTPLMPMSDVKTGIVRKFIAVKGHVIKARPKRLRVATADFCCTKCAASVTHAFDQGRYSTPTKCPSDQKCKSRSFKLLRQTARYINVQELRLQEAQEESTAHAGRTPRQLVVELKHDLIDSCRPGDIVLLACHVDAVNSAVAAGKTGKRAMETSTYKLFLQGHSITTLSESNSNRGDGKQKKTVYTQRQMQSIAQLCHADHRCLSLVERRAFPFDLLVRSLCPSIIGHHAVKAGILLCLLGGTPPATNSTIDKGASIRSNSHILVVGDPGMGKSQMLNAATQLAARSVYVGGNTASTTGLTVTLTKEEGGETGIEAGALVLADQGVACIDELDKCRHLDGLLEAMEQQQVSIAKAGIVASLPARCSVIAAANPKHGSYNMSKTVAENLNMARPILSRFDLVFILRDRADKEQDRLVSTNIMNLYRNRSADTAMPVPNAPTAQAQTGNGNAPSSGGRVSLEKRLAWVASFNDPLPAALVRDYIAYAREYCRPKLTREAAEILKEYYMNLRYPEDGRRRQDTVPITTRQLEALIRLSQARAKACLRDFVIKEDALDVVELLRHSVEQVHTDEFGIMDRTRGGAAGQSNRKMRKMFHREVCNVIGIGAVCSMDDLRRVAERVQCPLSDFQTMLEDMRENGTLIRKSDGRYKVVS